MSWISETSSRIQKRVICRFHFFPHLKKIWLDGWWWIQKVLLVLHKFAHHHHHHQPTKPPHPDVLVAAQNVIPAVTSYCCIVVSKIDTFCVRRRSTWMILTTLRRSSREQVSLLWLCGWSSPTTPRWKTDLQMQVAGWNKGCLATLVAS